MTNYNGWTNYATWRVNLEMFDGQPCEWITGREDVYDLGLQLRDLAQEYLEECGKGFALDYALAFVADVNWREIAQSMIDAYADQKEEA